MNENPYQRNVDENVSKAQRAANQNQAAERNQGVNRVSRENGLKSRYWID